MTKEPFPILRGLITLACLVGVPTVALVGIRSDKPAAASGPAMSASKAPSEPPSTWQPAVPTATIRNIAAAGDSAAGDSRLDEARPAGSRGDSRDEAAPELMTRQFQRLRALGASYYRLESAPDATADFWFHCRVAGIARPFEATNPVATNAIAQVLAEIEAFGDGRAATAASQTSVYRR
jgi:hypothetical protein